MARKVTGTIGDEQVKLENAATEATLQLLLDAIKNMPGASDAERKEAAEATQEFADNTSDAADASEEFADATGEAADASFALGSAFGKAQNLIGGFASGIFSVTNKMAGMAATFMTGGDTIDDVFGEFRALQPLTRVLQSNIDTFRSVSATGANFGNSLLDMRIAAANAQVSLSNFQSMVSNNSESMAMLGGSVSDGAKQFGQLSADLRTSEAGEMLMSMGYTIEDLNDGLGKYIELQARQGRLQQMSDQQLREGSEDYLKQLDALAKITGKNRDQQAELINENAALANVAAMRSKLEGEQLQNFDSSMALASDMGDEVGTVFKDLADGIPQTEFGKKISALVPGFADLAEAAGRGEISQAEFAERMQDVAPEMSQFRDQLGAAGIQALGGIDGMQSFFDSIVRMEEFAAKAADPGEIEEEQARRNEITQALTGFEQSISTIRSKIVHTFITSGVFESITDTLDNFADSVSPEDVEAAMDGLMPVFEDFGHWLGGLIDDIKEFGIVEVLQDQLGNIGQWIKEILFGAAPGLSDQEQEQQQSLEQQRQGLQSELQAMPDTDVGAVGRVRQEKAKEIERINRQLTRLDENAEGSEGVLSGLFDNFAVPAALTAGGALAAGGAAILGLTALKGVFAGFSAPPVAAGVAVITGLLVGTGAAIMAAGKGIDFAGDGVGKIADGLDRMSQLKDVAKLTEIGTALGSMGEAIVDLAFGNVIDAVTKLFGAKGPFDKIVAGVNKFKEVDDRAFDVITETGTALANVSTASQRMNVDAITGFASAVRQLGSPDLVGHLKSMVGADSPLQKMRKDIAEFASLDRSSLDSLSMVTLNLQDLNAVSQNLNAEPLDNYTNAMLKMSGSGLVDSLTSMFGGKSPIQDLANDLDKLANIDSSATKNLESLANINQTLDSAPIEDYTSAITDLTEALQNLNTELANDNDTLFNQNPSAGNMIAQQNQTQSQDTQQLERLNSIMTDILAVLMQSNDVSRRQLRSTRSLTSDLHRGF